MKPKTISLEYAGKIIRHYLELALKRGGVELHGDTWMEINEAFAAFDDVERRLQALEQVTRSLSDLHV